MLSSLAIGLQSRAIMSPPKRVATQRSVLIAAKHSSCKAVDASHKAEETDSAVRYVLIGYENTKITPPQPPATEHAKIENMTRYNLLVSMSKQYFASLYILANMSRKEAATP